MLSLVVLLCLSLTDAELEERIRERLEHSKIATEHFVVKVNRGAVVLEGNTAQSQAKAAATRIARNAGATKVENRIHVRETGKGRAGQRMNRARRTGRETKPKD